MPIPSQRVLELEKEVKELKRKFDVLVYQLKRIANITIIFEEDEDDKEG